MTAKYEAAMIFSVANGEEATLGLKEKFNDLIAKNGTIENVDEWGKRRLAYLINDDGITRITRDHSLVEEMLLGTVTRKKCASGLISL